MTIWNHPFFKPEELTCKCGCGGLPKEFFVYWLETLREEVDFPFRISSGYRCAKRNMEVSSTGDDGPHVQGVAADVLVYGAQALKLIEAALKHGVQGVGVAQNGPLPSRYIHLDLVGDMNTRPTMWSY